MEMRSSGVLVYSQQPLSQLQSFCGVPLGLVSVGCWIFFCKFNEREGDMLKDGGRPWVVTEELFVNWQSFCFPDFHCFVVFLTMTVRIYRKITNEID